jgi:parallel beta-helix repeat protein
LSGVVVLNRASQNLIGGERAPGACAGPCNLISDNTGAGVWVTGQTTRGNTIRGNEIHDNSGLGIDLGGSSAPDGITLNDATDGDSGPNDLLNAPMSLAADFDGTNTFVTGIVSATNATALTIDVYGKFDPANSGEAWRYLGKTTQRLTVHSNSLYLGTACTFPELSATAQTATTFRIRSRRR